MDPLARIRAQMQEDMNKEVVLHERRVKRQNDLQKIEKKKNDSLLSLALKEKFTQEAMMVARDPELKEAMEEAMLQQKRGMMPQSAMLENIQESKSLATDSSVEDMVEKLTTIGKIKVSGLQNSESLRPSINNKRTSLFPKFSLFEFSGKTLQEIRKEEAKKKRVAYIFNKDGKRTQIVEERDVEVEDYETHAHNMRFDPEATLSILEKSPSYKQKRARSDIQLEPLQLPHNRLRESFETNQEKFHKQFSKYDIMVLPSQQLKSFSLVPTFDMIEDDVREAKTKKIPTYLKQQKGQQMQTMNSKKLSTYWQELNSQQIEQSYRNRGLKMSDVLGTRFYDRVTKTKGEKLVQRRIKRLEREQKLAKEGGFEQDLIRQATFSVDQKNKQSQSVALQRKQSTFGISSNDGKKLNNILRQKMRQQQEALKEKRIKEQARQLSKSRINLIENNINLFESMDEIENPEHHIQIQTSLNDYLARKIDNSKKYETVFWDDERKRLIKMEEHYEKRKQSKKAIEPDQEQEMVVQIQKQKELLGLEGKLTMAQIIDHMREREASKTVLQNLADSRVSRTSVRLDTEDVNKQMMARIKSQIPEQFKHLSTMSQIKRVSKRLHQQVEIQEMTSDHIQSGAFSDLSKKLDMDNSTLENQKNIYLEELARRDKFYDSDDSDKELLDHLQDLQQDYLTVQLPEGSPLARNKRESENAQYRQVRENLRKTYMRKVEILEKDILNSNVKTAVGQEIFFKNISDGMRIYNRAKTKDLLNKHRKIVAREQIFSKIKEAIFI